PSSRLSNQTWFGSLRKSGGTTGAGRHIQKVGRLSCTNQTAVGNRKRVARSRHMFENLSTTRSGKPSTRTWLFGLATALPASRRAAFHGNGPLCDPGADLARSCRGRALSLARVPWQGARQSRYPTARGVPSDRLAPC